jgi:hypothetical protein
VGFNFEEDFSVGTIHGKNDAAHAQTTNNKATEVIESIDDDNVSILLSKTQDKLAADTTQRCKSVTTAGNRIATGSRPPVIGHTVNATPAGATGTRPVAAEGSPIPASTGTNGSADGGPGSQ